jgi:hypothetical protein
MIGDGWGGTSVTITKCPSVERNITGCSFIASSVADQVAGR